MIEGPILWSIASAVFTGGVILGGVKVSINGTKRRLDDIEANELGAQEQRVQVAERLGSLETKIDMIYNKVK